MDFHLGISLWVTAKDSMRYRAKSWRREKRSNYANEVWVVSPKIIRSQLDFYRVEEQQSRSDSRIRSFMAQQQKLTSFPLIIIDTTITSALQLQYNILKNKSGSAFPPYYWVNDYSSTSKCKTRFYATNSSTSFHAATEEFRYVCSWNVSHLPPDESNKTQQKTATGCRMPNGRRSSQDSANTFRIVCVCDNWTRLCIWHLFIFWMNGNLLQSPNKCLDQKPTGKKWRVVLMLSACVWFIAHTPSTAVHHLKWETHFDFRYNGEARKPNT